MIYFLGSSYSAWVRGTGTMTWQKLCVILMNPSSMHSLGNNLEGCLWGQTAMDCCRMGEQLELPARVCTSSTLRQAVTKKEMPSGEGAVQSRGNELGAGSWVTIRGETSQSDIKGGGCHFAWSGRRQTQRLLQTAQLFVSQTLCITDPWSWGHFNLLSAAGKATQQDPSVDDFWRCQGELIDTVWAKQDDAFHHLLSTNNEEPAGDVIVGGSHGCSDHETVGSKDLWGVRKEYSTNPEL